MLEERTKEIANKLYEKNITLMIGLNEPYQEASGCSIIIQVNHAYPWQKTAAHLEAKFEKLGCTVVRLTDNRLRIYYKTAIPIIDEIFDKFNSY